MNTNCNGRDAPPSFEKRRVTTPRIIGTCTGVAFVLFLLLFWILSPSIRHNKNLWVLFLYSFPSQFLIAVVPHEPVFLYFSKFYSPLRVTIVAIIGVLLTEALNYYTFSFFTDLKLSDAILKNKVIARLVQLFQKRPFLALWVAGITPLPFYPLRFLSVIARYPVWKYLLSIFLSRTPRFLFLALLGYTFNISNSLLAVLFVVIVVALYFPVVREALKKKKKNVEVPVSDTGTPT